MLRDTYVSGRHAFLVILARGGARQLSRRNVRTAWTRRCSDSTALICNLSKILVMCFSTAGTLMTRASAMPRFDFPSAIAAITSSSRGVSLAMTLRLRRRPSIRATTSGSTALPPSATRVCGVDELLHPADALLEQVPDALGAVGQQVRGVALLVVLREDEHARLRPLPAYLDGGPQAVVAVAGRHVDVGHEQVRAMGETLAQEIVRVARLSDHLEAGRREHSGDALAQEHIVLTDRHAQRRRHRDEPTARAGRGGYSAASQVASGAVASSDFGDERLRSDTPGVRGEPSAACTEVTTTRGRHGRAASSPASSKPSPSGSSTSTNAPSGFTRSAVERASATEPASATTVKAAGGEHESRQPAERRVVIHHQD